MLPGAVVLQSDVQSLVDPGDTIELRTLIPGTFFAEPLVRQAEHRRFVHVGVFVEDGLDLRAVHVLAGAQHHVLHHGHL